MYQRQVKASQWEVEEEGETHRGQVNKRRTLVAGGGSGEERGCDEERGGKEGHQSQQGKWREGKAPVRGMFVSVQGRSCHRVRGASTE